MMIEVPRLTPVVSSNLHSVGYDECARRLFVCFRRGDDAGALYAYDDVPLCEFAALIGAELSGASVGKVFNQRVKRGGFNFERIE